MRQFKLNIFKELVIPIVHPIAGRTLGQNFFKPQMIQLSAYSPQSFANFGHRIAPAKDAKENRD